jgi:hypothetical protein
MLDDIRDSDILDKAYYDMAPHFATRDMKEEALAVTTRIENFDLMCRAYLKLADIYQKKDAKKDAIMMLERMNKFVHLIDSLDSQVELYTGMASVYYNLGGHKTPLRFVNDAFDVLELIEPSKKKEARIRTLVTFLFENGYYKQGFDAISSLHSLPLQVELLENAPLPSDHKTRKKVEGYSKSTLKKILRRL